MKSKILIMGAAFAVAFSACKTTKSVSKPEQPLAQVVSKPESQIFDQLSSNQPQFRTANVSKLSMEIMINDRTVNVSGSARIRKDSAMYVSFQVFGLEVFKAEMTPDSMRVFDKMGRKYYVVDYGYFNRQFGVDADFYSLQSLFTAQFFCIGQRVPSTDKCTVTTAADGKKEIAYHTTDMEQITSLSDKNMISSVLLKSPSKNYSLQTTYSDYAVLNNINFPKEIALTAANARTKASCNFSILKAEFNTDIKFQPMATEKYTRGDINQMLKKF